MIEARTDDPKIRFSRVCEVLREVNPDAALADGFEDALVAIGRRFNSAPVAVYDTSLCLDILMRDGMTREEASEHFEFNVIGAWVGDGTPIFISYVTGGDL